MDPTNLKIIDTKGHIAEITLDRQEVLNALNRSLLDSLEANIAQVSKNPNLRLLVIRGAGEKAFSAGADLKERAHMTLEDTRGFINHINRVFDAIETLEIPTVAFINGVAFGGGLELALACDMRVMSPQAELGLTECSLGIIPGAGGTQRLPKLIGYAKAAELIFSAKRVSAQEALQLGLINHVADMLSETSKLTQSIAKCSRNSLRLAKQAMKTGQEFKAYEQVLEHPDRLEGLAAFKEKRLPCFL